MIKLLVNMIISIHSSYFSDVKINLSTNMSTRILQKDFGLTSIFIVIVCSEKKILRLYIA